MLNNNKSSAFQFHKEREPTGFICNETLDSCQVNISNWQRGISLLVSELLSGGEGRDGVFSEQFWTRLLWLCVSAACKTLLAWRREYIWHDAEDIASEVIRIFVSQHRESRGVFDSTKGLSAGQLGGYLNNAIWRSVQQRASEFLSKANPLSKLSAFTYEAPSCSVPDPRLRIDMIEAFKRLQAENSRSLYGRCAGLSPLAALFDLAFAESSLEGIPRRTLQRFKQTVRERFQHEMER